MKSAGYAPVGPGGYPPSDGYASGGYPSGGIPTGGPATPMSTYRGHDWSGLYSGGGFKLNANVNIDSEEGKKLIDKQLDNQAAGMGIAAFGQLVDSTFEHDILRKQYGLAEKRFELQGKAIDADVRVKLAEFADQAQARREYVTTLREDNRHKEEMSRLEKRAGIAIKRIEVEGQNRRAEIYAANSTFNPGDRRGYPFGSPFTPGLT